MAVEAVPLTSLLKYLWVGVIIPAFLYLFNRQDKHEKKVFTKMETLAQIDSHLAPVLVEIEQSKEARKENTEAVRGLTTLITDLRIDLAGRDSTHRTRDTDN